MKNTAQISSIKNVFVLYTILLLVWGFYRVLFKLPDTVEEVILKPVIWLIPLFYFLHKEKRGLSSIGWTFKNLFQGIYFGIGLGVLFSLAAVLSNLVKYGGVANFSSSILQNQNVLLALAIAFITAISEETVFRGFILTRLINFLKDTYLAIIITTIGWIIIHIPVLIFVNQLDFSSLLIQIILAGIFSLGSCFVYLKTNNIMASILVNVLWGFPILLFR